MRHGILTLVAGGALLAAWPGQAATLFSENFADEALAFASQLNFTDFDPFTVSDGTVDFIAGSAFGITCETFGCVDLDGSTGNSGLLSAPLSFLGGVTYTFSGWMSGNQRNGATEDVQFGIVGGVSAAVTVAPGNVFQEYGFSFTPANDLSSALFFQDQGNDNVGAVLDRVSVTFDADDTQPPIVPLPASALLLLGGLGALRTARHARR